MSELPGLDALADVLDPVAERFGEAGHRIYLVGGVVRDLVLAAERGGEPDTNDLDLTTDARPAEIKRLLSPLADALWAQGERFGTIGAMVCGHALEVTTHRAEAYEPGSRKPTVSFGDDIDDDLERRDFTINAMAVELPGGRLHDPHHGRDDLAGRRLRTPLSPEISFTDDPLRMLRAARFIPRFGVDPAPELVAAATELAPRLAIVSVERVADELERLLAVADPTAGFDFLARTGLLARVVTGYGPDGPAGPGDPDRARALASAPGDPLVRRAGLLWPIRARAADELGRLRYSRADTIATNSLLAAAERVVAEPIDEVLVRRLAARIGPAGLDPVVALVANVTSPDPGPSRRLAEVVATLRAAEDLGDLDGPLSGVEVMEVLDLDPGPEVGRARDHLRELRIVRGPLSPDDARRELAAWWRERGAVDR